MEIYRVGDKVFYAPIGAGIVLGKVTKLGRDFLGDFLEFKVTSRSNPVYPCGTLERVPVGCPWLHKR